ncbi:unnamed protein product [Lupinus luteus]|uniref:Uncharacterized protein n=1 Tax=Lupinus luteus TaxID=3873 RepID=A0AAV1W4F9_LUPLU
MVVHEPLEGPGAGAGASRAVDKATDIEATTTNTAQEILFISIIFFSGGGLEFTAQEVLAPAPAPEKDTGAGSLVTYSAAFLCFSLLLSFLSLLRH